MGTQTANMGKGASVFTYTEVYKEIEGGHLQQVIHHMSHGKTSPTTRCSAHTEGVTQTGPEVKGEAQKIGHGHGYVVVDKLQPHPIGRVLYGGGRQTYDAEAQHFAQALAFILF